MKNKNKILMLGQWSAFTLLSVHFLGMQAEARQIAPLLKTVADVLGTSKASKKVIGKDTVFYSKDAAGKASKVAVIAHATWGGRCTHEWVIGLDYPTNKITKVAVTELSCPHADPINESGFLDQFKGKGPVEVKGVKRLSGINTVVKATGSSDLTNEEVVKAIALIEKNHAAF
ncbi:MAG: hypothetical protein H7333_05315 [Bdellovibrionales bacterium]|nr:hypothetical protein [Oligoflexia bacterium]